MKSLNIVESNPRHNLPNMVDVFGKEIKDLVIRLERIKGNQFSLGMDLGYSMVNYTVELLNEYQTQGNGTIPENIKNKIWEQVIKGVALNYEIPEEYFKEITKIFENKVKERSIIQESIQFLTAVRTK